MFRVFTTMLFKNNHKRRKVTILCIEFSENFGAFNNLLSQLEFIHQHYVDTIKTVVIGSKNQILVNISEKLNIPFYPMDFIELDYSQLGLFAKIHRYLSTLCRCFFIALRHNPDLIYCSHYPWSIYGNPLGFLLHKQVIIHLKDVFLLQPKLSRILMKFNRKTVFIAISNHVFSLFSNVFKVNSKKMIVIKDGVNAAVFTPNSLPNIKRKMVSKKKVISMFSRIEPERDVELFIDTAYLISQQYPDVYFEHHGYLKNRFNERYVQSLRDRIKRLSLTKKFNFISYHHSREDVVSAYKSSFLVIVTAREFALPNTAIESMMCGTPVIAFKTGGNVEVIKDQNTGSLVPYHSAVFFARELSTYLAGKKDYLVYAQRAIRYSRQQFAGEKKLKQLIEFYLETVGD